MFVCHRDVQISAATHKPLDSRPAFGYLPALRVERRLRANGNSAYASPAASPGGRAGGSSSGQPGGKPSRTCPRPFVPRGLLSKGLNWPQGPRTGDGEASNQARSAWRLVVPAVTGEPDPSPRAWPEAPPLPVGVHGQPGPAPLSARPTGDETWTVRRSGSSSPGCMRR